jgi:RNA polymerase sigma-70 factor (ECF subfamily)
MDEERLIAGLRGEDPGAVQELVHSCGDRLLRCAFLLCGNQTEAEDIVQDTFVQAMKSIHRFRGQSGLYPWLRGILMNLTRHYHRDRKRLVYDYDLVGRELAQTEAPSSGLDLEITSSTLAQGLGRLSAAHRDVLVLRYYENMKIAEMAGQLGVSEGTVKSRLHYATREMQKLLPSEMNFFGSQGNEERIRK